MINKREAYIALFSIIVGMANVFFIIFNADSGLLHAFSFALSIAVFYFAYRELMTLDFMKQIKNMILLASVEQDLAKAWGDAVSSVKDVENPWVEKE